MDLLLATREDARRISEVVMRDEGRPRNGVEPGVARQPRAIETHWVEITSTTKTDERYPGTLYWRNHTDTTPAYVQVGDAGGIWIGTPNGETLTTGVKYPARAAGVKSSDSKPCFDVLTARGFSGARVKQVVQNNINDKFDTEVEFDDMVFDTDSFWSAGQPKRLTAPAAGYYQAITTIIWGENATGLRHVKLINNGGGGGGDSVIDSEAHAGVYDSADITGGPAMNVAGITQMNAGDFLTVVVWHNAGTTLGLAGAAASLHRL